MNLQDIKRVLRPVKNSAFRLLYLFIPNKTSQEIKALWNQLGEKNACYFVNTKTSSGEKVGELEVQSTGEADYRKYVLDDPFLEPFLCSNREKRVLDLGCGIGRMTECFSRHFGEVWGVDIAPSMIEVAKTRLAAHNNVIFKVNDGVSLPCPDKHFDFVFSYLVLQHCPEIQFIKRCVKEVFRTLKYGGVAKIQFRTGAGIEKWKWSYGVALTPEEAIVVTKDIGFTVLNHSVEGGRNLWLLLGK